jgi:excisionase family DNA binding protein
MPSPPAAPEQDELLAQGAMSVRDASSFTGIPRSNLYELMQQRKLPSLKVGRRRLIPKAALIELLREGLSK